MSTGLVRGMWLVVVGMFGFAAGVYWLYTLKQGITPRWFTKSTRHMDKRLQWFVAVWMVIADLMIAAAGFAIVLGLDIL